MKKKNKIALFINGIITVLIAFVLIGSLSLVLGQLATINGGNNGNEDNEGTGNGGNSYVDIGANGEALEPTQVQYEVTTSFEGDMLFQTYTYGNYTKTNWNNNKKPYYISYDDLNPMYFVSQALKDYDYLEYDMSISKYNPIDFNIIPYFIQNGPSNNNDFVINYAYGKDYDIKFTPYNDITDSSIKLNHKYASIEQKYYNYCVDNYLKVPKSTKEKLEIFMSDNDLNVNDPNIIKKIKNFMLSYKNEFKESNDLDISDDLVIDLIEGNVRPKELHYASCATLMYRLINIPSRIAAGYKKTIKKDVTNIIDISNHTIWTEIYIKGLGWIPIEVVPNLDEIYDNIDPNQDIHVSNRIYKIKPYDVHSSYDGNEHKSDNRIQGLTRLLDRGYTYEATVSGSRKELGISYSYISTFILFDAGGNDVTNKYYFDFDRGIIQVYYSILKVKTADIEKTYDGISITNDDYEVNRSLLKEGHYISEEYDENEYRNAGRYLNIIKFKIFDYDDNDVTDIYYIINDFGHIDIKPRDLVITTFSSRKKYDGTTLYNNNYEKVGLVNTDKLEIVINGRQKDVGKSINSISKIKIYDINTKANSISNYHVIYNYGTLEVYE